MSLTTKQMLIQLLQSSYISYHNLHALSITSLFVMYITHWFVIYIPHDNHHQIFLKWVDFYLEKIVEDKDGMRFYSLYCYGTIQQLPYSPIGSIWILKSPLNIIGKARFTAPSEITSLSPNVWLTTGWSLVKNLCWDW